MVKYKRKLTNCSSATAKESVSRKAVSVSSLTPPISYSVATKSNNVRTGEKPNSDLEAGAYEAEDSSEGEDKETSFCTLTMDTDLEYNAWQNAVKALSGKNNALQEQTKLLKQSVHEQRSRELKLCQIIEALEQENQRLRLENRTLCDFSVKLKREIRELKASA